MKTAISVGQIMAQIMCVDYDLIDRKDISTYESFANNWNHLSKQTRELIINDLTTYIKDCVGKDNVEN